MEPTLHLCSFNAVTSDLGTDVNVGGFKLDVCCSSKCRSSADFKVTDGTSGVAGNEKRVSLPAGANEKENVVASGGRLDLGVHVSEDYPGET